MVADHRSPAAKRESDELAVRNNVIALPILTIPTSLGGD
jgi:hypothetical protein